MEFSKEQQEVLNKYIEGENVFITGPGGSGKSAIIREIYRDANEKRKNIKVCALTGCAAVLLQCNAKTIHSWSGIGQGSGNIEYNVKRILESTFRKANWLNTDILVVDEISMMSLKLFEMLDSIGRNVRKSKSHLPFGGIQLIFSGDFFQLPPVGDVDEPETSQFCFESLLWNETFMPENQIKLVRIFRQADPVYANILNQLREGKLKRSSYEILLTRVGACQKDDSIIIQPTKLFPKRHRVELINTAEMEKMTTEEQVYKMKRVVLDASSKMKTKTREMSRITSQDVDHEYNYLEKNVPSEMTIKLKVGAQVMCIINMDDNNLCNGSQGVITRFNEKNLPVVKFHGISQEIVMDYHTWVSEGITNIGVAQIPLILAWALTIHKAQGTTLEVAEIDVGNNVFECGQTYVALS